MGRSIYAPNEIWIEAGICYIQIYNRKGNPKCVSLVDAEDYDKVKEYKWSVNNNMMVGSHDVGLLSRLVMNVSSLEFDVDHKNHNRLDNRKCNLRVCSRLQNNMNKRIRKDNQSGYKGVSWVPKLRKWKAIVNCGGVRFYLGCFTCKLEAAVKYNEKAKELYGEFAFLNEIRG